MKSEAQAINDARVAIRDVIRELKPGAAGQRGRGPNAERREHLVRKLNGALVELNTADIVSGRVGVGASLSDEHAAARRAAS